MKFFNSFLIFFYSRAQEHVDSYNIHMDKLETAMVSQEPIVSQKKRMLADKSDGSSKRSKPVSSAFYDAATEDFARSSSGVVEPSSEESETEEMTTLSAITRDH